MRMMLTKTQPRIMVPHGRWPSAMCCCVFLASLNRASMAGPAEAFGTGNSVSKRLRRRVRVDTFHRIFQALPEAVYVEYTMSDSRIVKVQRHGQGSRALSPWPETIAGNRKFFA